MSSKDGDAVQRLPPEGTYTCAGCGREVVFRVVQSKRVRRKPGMSYAYLACPLCGHRATQLRSSRRFPPGGGKP
ncbi:MAG: hypothetical protein PUJ80_11560 [Verrucomicrobiota bacterium]|nr:hypothetical protein [Verrucomicrobiota bacterium]MDY5597082.1 hypothetical protein [Kiritimatiellia bacterium]